MWLVRVQAALWLETGGWRWALRQGRHARSGFAAHTRLVMCVRACLCVCLPFSSLFLCSDLWPFLCTASCISPPWVPEYSFCSRVSHILPDNCCALQGTSCSCRYEKQIPVHTPPCRAPFSRHRSPLPPLARWIYGLNNQFVLHPRFVNINSALFFLGFFLKKKYRYVSLCTCMETLMDLYEWRQRKKEPTRSWRCGREMARGQTTGRKCPNSLLASNMGMKKFNLFKLNKICFKS